MNARLVLSALALVPLALTAQENDPPGRAGRVSSVAGTVGFQANGAPDWTLAPLNYTVTSGDRLLTHRQSRAEIEVGPFDVRLSDSTDLSVVHLTDDFAQLGLSRGTIRVTVYRLASRDSMEVDTPNGAIIIRSAGKYRVDVLEGVSTIVSVEEGVAELSGPSLDYAVKRGQTVELTGSNAISANMVPHPRNTEFDQWSFDRDRRQESSMHSTYMSRDIPGGADLDRYGSWNYHASYGYVWRPRVVTVGWVPYRHGRWVWTGPWGWSWVEDAPWGYAPFHYGRWVVVGGVWAWAPGPIIRRPCYAPALVVFINGPRHHQAWFPLGWHEPYYPRYRHSDRYLRTVNIANVRNISNVDDFVDPRRADRVGYSNRQATTVVAADVFGRRPVAHDVANVRNDEITRAPIARDRWEGPRVATRPSGSEMTTPASIPSAGETRPSPFRRRDYSPPQGTSEPMRTAEPTRMAAPTGVTEAPRARPESREGAPLIYRNAPPYGSRERPSVFRRAEPAQSPQAAEQPRSAAPTQAPQPAERSRGWNIVRPQSSSPQQERASIPRASIPRESSPRASSPRESSPVYSSPRETGSREARIRPPEPRASSAPPSGSRAPSVTRGAQRRPPA